MPSGWLLYQAVPSNVLYPMLVTLLGILMLVRPEQLSNASSSILVTLFGITTLVSPEQYWNAPYLMLVTQ